MLILQAQKTPWCHYALVDRLKIKKCYDIEFRYYFSLSRMKVYGLVWLELKQDIEFWGKGSSKVWGRQFTPERGWPVGMCRFPQPKAEFVL